MPACTYGARPKPGVAGLEEWLAREDLPQELIDILIGFARPAWAAVTATLVNPIGICTENPDPPTPITVEDVIAQTGTSTPSPSVAQAIVVQKAYQWLRYQQFLLWCDCNDPPEVPGHNCIAAPASFQLGSLGSIAGPWPVTVDQSVIDSWAVYPNGDWEWAFEGGATIDGGAFDGFDLILEYQAQNGAWILGPDLRRLNLPPAGCELVTYQASTPKFSTQTAVRLRNAAGGVHQIDNLTFCFCPRSPSPPALPIQPPLTGTPLPPALACGTEDLCAMVTELAHRLTVVASQVSDIQASLTSTGVLQELARLTMTQEGESPLVLGTRAVSVELTALGDEAFTSALGRPRGLMRVGSVRWFDGVGYSPRRFIDADRFNDTRPAGALSISWQLLPGTQGILKFLG